METPPSPTGLPLLPVKIVPYLAGVVALAAVVQNIVGPGTLAFQIASAVVAFGTVLGLASPGLRKTLPDVPKAQADGQAAGEAVDSQAKAVDVLKGK